MPAVSDRARSTAPTEKVPNEANDETSPLRAYMACGASVLHHRKLKVVLSRPCSSSSDHDQPARPCVTLTLTLRYRWQACNLAPRSLPARSAPPGSLCQTAFPSLTDSRPELTSPRRRGRVLYSVGKRAVECSSSTIGLPPRRILRTGTVREGSTRGHVQHGPSPLAQSVCTRS